MPGRPKRGTPAYDAWVTRKSQFDREVVERNPKGWGWWEYWLVCGHGLKIAVDPPCYEVGGKISCFRCKQAAALAAEGKAE